MRRTGFLLVAIALSLCSGIAAGQTPTLPPPVPSIVVSAEAVITAKPDQAFIEIGVLTQSSTAQAATADNAQRVETTIAAVRKLLDSNAEIKTIGYSVRPVYRYAKEGGTPAIAGYSVSNIVQIKMNDLSGVGRLIDAAMASGSNTVQRLEFVLKDSQAVQLQALAEAAARAKAKAQVMASALGLKMGRILRAEEQGGFAAPIAPNRGMLAMAADSVAPATQVEPGTIEVRVSVTLTVEVGL
jgi:uncharacterized protein YggE